MDPQYPTIAPIRIVIFISFCLLGGVLFYATFMAPSSDIRTRASCEPGTRLVTKEVCTPHTDENGTMSQSCTVEAVCEAVTTNLKELRKKITPRPIPVSPAP